MRGILNEGFPELAAGEPVFVAERPKLRSNKVLRAGLALATVATLVSCSDGGGEGADPAAGDETTTTTEAPTTTTTSERPTTTTTTTRPSSGANNDSCEAVTGGWNTQPESVPTMAVGSLVDVEIGKHECYDRISFTIDGVVPGPEIAGYHVEYAPNGSEVATDGEDNNYVATDGSTALGITIRAWPEGSGMVSETPPPDDAFMPEMREDLFVANQLQQNGWAYNDVTYAGAFEGHTLVAVGTDGEKPFAVNSYEKNGETIIYVDIPH